jgi:PAS domain S-box-containing protein
MVKLNMTEISRTEQANALLAAVVASSMDAVFSIDSDARIQTWNSAAEQLYGYPAAEAIGQPLALLVPDAPNYSPGDKFQRVLQGEQIYFETSRRRKDGSLVEVGISAAPIRDSSGKVIGVSVVHRDISERQRAERDLRQIHQWLEMAQEAGDVAPWAYDPATDEMRWTNQLYRQLGYGPGDVMPSLPAFRARVHPEDQARLDGVREKEAKAEPGTQFQCELRLVRPNENSCWVDRRSRVVEHQGRRQIIGVNVDISQRKRQEDDLRFVMNELSHRTKNLLAVVQAMASQTAQHTASFSNFEESFVGRLLALSQSHDLLVSRNWSGAPLVDLIFAHLMPFVEDETRIQATGPSISLRAQAAQSLGIILHELATNASKYGALSVPAGKIVICWDSAPQSIQLSWREKDGPVVNPPTHFGFGRTIIERIADDMFGGVAKLELLPTGAHWSASIPQSLIVQPHV